MASGRRFDTVERLDGTNFSNWRFQIQLALETNDLWEVVNGDSLAPPATTNAGADLKAWKKQDIEARSIIAGTINRVQLNRIRNCTNAKSMFDRLVTANSDSSQVNQQHTLTKFLSFTVKKGQTSVQAMEELEEIALALDEMGIPQSEESIITKLVYCLPKKYAAFQTAWRSVAAADQTRVNLLARLKSEEISMRQHAEEESDNEEVVTNKAYRFEHNRHDNRRSRSQSRPRQSGPPNKQRSDLECYNCKKPGHFARQCPEPQKYESKPTHSAPRKEWQPRRSTSRNGRAFSSQARETQVREARFLSPDVAQPRVAFKMKALSGRLRNPEKSLWVSDSGATFHVCGDKGWYTNFNPLAPEQAPAIELADGRIVQPLGIGTVVVNALWNTEWTHTEIHDVYYLPGGANLFSELVMVLKGYTITRDLHQTKFMKDGETGPVAHIVDNAFVMQFRPVVQKGFARAGKFLKGDKCTALWHRRFNHGHLRALREAARKGAVIGLSVEDVSHEVPCHFCQLGKQCRLPFPRVTHEDNAKPGERIYADLSGREQQATLGGAHYFLLMKDHATTYRKAYLLKHKSDAAIHIKEFINLLENQTGRTVKEFLTDNGTEFVNRNLKTFFHEQGIRHITSAPYCPQTNGKIEREMRTIKESARTTLLASDLPYYLWGEAVNTAVYLLNRMLNKRSPDITPYEGIFGKKPSVAHLRVFGCRAYAYTQESRRNTYGAKSTPCVLVGYCEATGVYRLYDEDSRQIFGAKHVTFFEDEPEEISVYRRPVYKEVENVQPQSPATSPSGKKKIIPDPHLSHFESEAEDDDDFEDNDQPPHYDGDSGDDEDNISTDSYVPSPDRGDFAADENDIANDDEYHDAGEVDEEPEPFSYEDEPAPVPVQPVSGPSTPNAFQPRMHEITFSTPEGEYTAQVPEGSTTQVVIPNKKVKKTSSFFKPEVLTSRLRPRKEKNTTNQLYQSTVRSVNSASDTKESEPNTYKQALVSPQCNEWATAMAEEIASQEANQTWEIMPRPPGTKLLDTKWVYKLKKHDDGSIARYKARLVIRGYLQEYGIDYSETFASVARYETVRTLLAIAACEGQYIEQFDVKTAFLHGEVKEDIYVKIPAGYDAPKDHVLKLNKSIYGLKQSPRCWYETISKALRKIGLRPTKNEPCVFMGQVGKDKVTLALFVDDGLVFSANPDAVDYVLKKLAEQFELTRGAPSTYIGLEIARNAREGTIRISQRRYIADMLAKFGMEDCNPSNVPMQPSTELKRPTHPREDLPYRQLVGSLLFLARCTRPDIAFAVSRLAQFCSSYDESHWKAAKCVLRYLKGTMDLGITYRRGEVILVGFSDADYATCKLDRRSTTGVLFKINGSPVSWWSQKQGVVAQSTMEAEYMSASSAARELQWLRAFLIELGYRIKGPILLYVDNQSAIRSVRNPEMHSRTKHIDIRFHHIRDLQRDGILCVVYIHTSQQEADALTKPLMKTKLEESRELIGLKPPHGAIKEKKNVRFTSRKAQYHLGLPMVILCVLSMFGSTTAVQNTPLVIWRKSLTPVTIGSQFEVLMIDLVHSCTTELNNNDFHHEMLREAHYRCIEAYNTLILEPLSKMCPVIDSDESGDVHARPRREPFTLATLAVIGIATSIGAAATAVASTVILGGKISKLEDREHEITKTLIKMEQQIQHNYEKVHNLTLKYNQAMTEMDKLALDHDEMKGKMISTNFAISNLISKFVVGRAILQDANHLWKEGRISQGFLDFLQIQLPCEPHCPVRFAQAIKCNMSKDKAKILMQFYVPIASQDFALVKADPYDIMVTKENSTCRGVYSGPKYLILSQNQSCVYSADRINEASGDPVLIPSDGCLPKQKPEENQYFSLEQCKPTKARDELEFVQVKLFNNHANIYCPASTLTIDGVEGPCRDDVMSLPISTNFTINGMQYRASSVKATVHEKLDPTFTVKANWHLQLAANFSALQIDEKDDFKEIKIDEILGSYANSYWTTGLLIGVVLILVVIIIFMIKRSNKPITVSVTAKPVNNVAEVSV